MSDFMLLCRAKGLLHKDLHETVRLELEGYHLEFFWKGSLLSVYHRGEVSFDIISLKYEILNKLFSSNKN